MAPLPFYFFSEMLRKLIRRGDTEFITYDDLDWGDDYDYQQSYPVEWATWKAQHRQDQKAYILIQHDVDSGPAESVAMAAAEDSLGIRSSVMTFARWRGPGDLGEIQEYPIDWSYLHHLESRGFCIAYHCNALQIANFDMDRVAAEFQQDVDFLEKKLKLKFFSPHGGRLGPHGEANAHVEYPRICETNLRWVHNRYSAKFHKVASDGGLTGRLKRGDAPDLRLWANSIKRGGRFRLLAHPQYYSNERFVPFEGDVLPDWYRYFIDLVHRSDIRAGSEEFWKD